MGEWRAEVRGGNCLEGMGYKYLSLSSHRNEVIPITSLTTRWRGGIVIAELLTAEFMWAERWRSSNGGAAEAITYVDADACGLCISRILARRHLLIETLRMDTASCNGSAFSCLAEVCTCKWLSSTLVGYTVSLHVVGTSRVHLWEYGYSGIQVLAGGISGEHCCLVGPTLSRFPYLGSIIDHSIS